jgi:hypothetical protein
MCGGKTPDGPPKKSNEEDNQATQKSANLKPTAIPKKVATKKFLDAILLSKELTQALESFLEAEFCLENLLFIQKVGVYKDSLKNVNFEDLKKRKQQELLRDAIQQQFMLPSSEAEVLLVLYR